MRYIALVDGNAGTYGVVVPDLLPSTRRTESAPSRRSSARPIDGHRQGAGRSRSRRLIYSFRLRRSRPGVPRCE
jgi:hypothetical protein